jgi:heme/copper-type cytochrome/quinol oxidase subunit 2
MFSRTVPVRDGAANFFHGVAGIRGQNNHWRWSMTFVWVMWIVWGVLVLITAILYLYRSRLSRDEEDQIFLDDSFSSEQAEQAAIVAKVNKVQPVLRTCMWIVAIATLFVIGYYIWDIITQFK